MRKPPIVHATRPATTSRFLRVELIDLEFSNGERRTYERLKGSGLRRRHHRADADDDTVLLVREYGAGIDRYELGLPKGRLDRDETVEQGAEPRAQGRDRLRRARAPHPHEAVAVAGLHDVA